MAELAEEFYSYGLQKNELGGQVFVSTHSPDFLNGVELNNIFWLEKKDGITQVYRANDDSMLKALYEEGDLPGALWKQGLFGGANP